MPDRLRRTWPAVLVATLLAVLVSPTAAQSAPTRCPGTFQVLHNDHIGRLSLPAGPYVIDVIDSSRLSCAGASDLFRQFLEDFDGRLPRPWVLNGSSRTFTRGSGSTTGFQVTRSSGGGGGGGGRHPATGLACPSFFHVLHNDHIGRLRLPAGEYRITLLSLNRISCAQASRYFAQFLQDFDGRLPRPWVLGRGDGQLHARQPQRGLSREADPAPRPTRAWAAGATRRGASGAARGPSGSCTATGSDG